VPEDAYPRAVEGGLEHGRHGHGIGQQLSARGVKNRGTLAGQGRVKYPLNTSGQPGTPGRAD
jgi:hypothetical protein